jgi:hypothetical protein
VVVEYIDGVSWIDIGVTIMPAYAQEDEPPGMEWAPRESCLSSLRPAQLGKIHLLNS